MQKTYPRVMKSKTLCDLLAVFCTKITKLVQQAAPRARIHEGMCTNFIAMHAVFMLQGTQICTQ